MKRNNQPVKKAHLSTWDDDNIESGDEEEKEEEVFLCFIALEDKNIEVYALSLIMRNVWWEVAVECLK